MSVHLPLVALHLFLTLAPALIVAAPDLCGGTRVVTHAKALFGPRPTAALVHDVHIFVPRVQAAGAYLREALPTAARNPLSPLATVAPAHRLLTALFSAPSRPLRHSGIFVSAAPLSARAGAQAAQSPSPSASPAAPLPLPLPLPLPPFLTPLLTLALPPLSVSRRSATESPAAPLPAPLPPQSGQVAGGAGDGYEDVDEPGEKSSDARAIGPTLDSAAESAGSVKQPANGSDSQLPVPDGTRPVPQLFNACLPLSVPADQRQMRGRVAVVARGVCDFAQKVLHMQEAGAVAVMVVNFEEQDDFLANMKLNETKSPVPDIRIPSLMISFKDWRAIAPCRANTTVVFSAEGEATFDVNQGREALNWAMMRGMALWILCQCGVNVVRYKRRVSDSRERANTIASLPVDSYSRMAVARRREEMRSEALRRASEDETAEAETVASEDERAENERSALIAHDERLPAASSISSATNSSASTAASASTAISTATSSALETATNGTSATAAVADDGIASDDSEEPACAICLEDFVDRQAVRVLACSHLYHRTCIDPWLQSSSNCCPLCKREIPDLPPPPSHLHYGSMTV